MDSTEGGAAAPARAGRPARRVKQPLSYAEPSASAKLRRGDVYFPKADPAERGRTAAGPAAAGGRASPATDLDCIMGRMSSDVQ